MAKKLITDEEGYELESVMDMPGFKVVKKLLRQLVEEMQDEVISVSMDQDGAEQKLLYRKIRAEGAEGLMVKFSRFVGKQKSSGDVITGGNHGRNKRGRNSARGAK